MVDLDRVSCVAETVKMHLRHQGRRREFTPSVDIQAISGTAILGAVAVAEHVAASSRGTAVGDGVAAEAFASVFNAGKQKVGRQAGGGAPVNCHLGRGDRGAANAVGQGAAGSALRVAAHVHKAIDTGVGLWPDHGGAVEEVETAGAATGLSRISGAGHVALGSRDLRGGRSQAVATKALNRIFNTGIRKPPRLAEIDTCLDRHVGGVCISGGANGPSGDIRPTSFRRPRSRESGGNRKLGKGKGDQEKERKNECGPHGQLLSSWARRSVRTEQTERATESERLR